VTDDGTECSFRGTYLEVEPPTRTVQTWHMTKYDGLLANFDNKEDYLRSLRN
jgi:uncharacterized protein YndB with AHSA1/START domain